MSSSVKRNQISDEQRSILDALYNEGMVGTALRTKPKLIKPWKNWGYPRSSEGK